MFDNPSEIISTAANVTMVAVWLVYLQLILKSFTRQTRSNLIISRDISDEAEPQCAIANMSVGKFYIQNIVVRAEADGRQAETDITDRISRNDNATFQGPMDSGACLHAGAFETLIHHAAEEDRGQGAFDGLDAAESVDLTVTVVGVHGSADKPVAAQRGFRIARENGKRRVHTLERTTAQHRIGPRRRRIVNRLQKLR